MVQEQILHVIRKPTTADALPTVQKAELKAPAFSPPVLKPAPTRDSDQLTNLHAVKNPHAEYFKNINFEKLSPFNQLCEKIYSNTATLNTLDLNKYPNLPSSDINLIKYFQENNNALDKALNALKSSERLDLNNSSESKRGDAGIKTNLLDLIDKTDSALILLNESLFLDHFCQTTNPKGLSKIRLKQDIAELEEQQKIIQSYLKQDKDIFKKSKGFGTQDLNPQSTLEQFSNIKSKYFKYNFSDNAYLPNFIFALNTIKDPETSLAELQIENQKLQKPYSIKELQKTINENFVKESLKTSKALLQLEIQLSKQKLESLTADEPKIKNRDIKASINTEGSFTEKAINIGVGQFYLNFLNKILDKVSSSAIKETSRTVKTGIKNNFVNYLQELVNHEQSGTPLQNPPSSLKNLTADEIVPDLNFFPPTAPQDYSSTLLQFWENILQNNRVDNKNYSILLQNGLDNKQRDSFQHPSDTDLLQVGKNYEYLKQENFEIRTLGNYVEARFLLSLQTLANNRDDLTIIVPNTVGWLNNRLKTDVIIIKQDQEGAKILALDCKASRSGCLEHNDDKTPSIAYHPPRSNLYSSPTNPNQELSRNLDSLFNHPNAYANLPINDRSVPSIHEGNENAENEIVQQYLIDYIKTKLTDPKIFSKPSQNFYQLQDTEEARALEKDISIVLQAKYNEN